MIFPLKLVFSSLLVSPIFVCIIDFYFSLSLILFYLLSHFVYITLEICFVYDFTVVMTRKVLSVRHNLES